MRTDDCGGGGVPATGDFPCSLGSPLDGVAVAPAVVA